MIDKIYKGISINYPYTVTDNTSTNVQDYTYVINPIDYTTTPPTNILEVSWPKFKISVDRIKTLKDSKKVIEILQTNRGNLFVNEIDGIEHLVLATSDCFDPKEIVKLRKKGVKFVDKKEFASDMDPINISYK